MTSGIKYSQGEILITPFPFTDLTSVKQRPVLVLSKDNSGEDIITCAITSNLKDKEFAVLITQADLAEGTIPITSLIKIGKLFTLEKSIIKKSIGRIKTSKMNAVQKIFRELV